MTLFATVDERGTAAFGGTGPDDGYQRPPQIAKTGSAGERGPTLPTLFRVCSGALSSGPRTPFSNYEAAMKSPAAIAASLLSAVLVVAAACAAPANPRPDAATADPADPSVIWDYRQVTVVPELLNKHEMAAAVGRSYPTALRAQGVTGAVTLELVTSREGVVESVSVLSASDRQFGDAARLVAERMRFVPASVRGIPVRCRFTLPIRFDLQR